MKFKVILDLNTSDVVKNDLKFILVVNIHIYVYIKLTDSNFRTFCYYLFDTLQLKVNFRNCNFNEEQYFLRIFVNPQSRIF